jgi:hypothetical protein
VGSLRFLLIRISAAFGCSNWGAYVILAPTVGRVHFLRLRRTRMAWPTVAAEFPLRLGRIFFSM